MNVLIQQLCTGGRWCLGGLVVLLCLSGCLTLKKAGAGAALPVAVAGDTALVPFQFLGFRSLGILSAAEKSGTSSSSGWGYEVTTHHDSPMMIVYYAAGYSLAPFIPFTMIDYYSMTSACWDAATSTHVYRRRRIRF